MRIKDVVTSVAFSPLVLLAKAQEKKIRFFFSIILRIKGLTSLFISTREKSIVFMQLLKRFGLHIFRKDTNCYLLGLLKDFCGIKFKWLEGLEHIQKVTKYECFCGESALLFVLWCK